MVLMLKTKKMFETSSYLIFIWLFVFSHNPVLYDQYMTTRQYTAYIKL